MFFPLSLLAQIQVQVSPAELRWELLKLAVAIVLLSLGGLGMAFYFSRSKARERTLVYFGLFSVLYAVRLLGSLGTVQLCFGFSPAFWAYFNWIITAVIILPFEMFLYELADSQSKGFLRWLVRIQATLSCLGIVLAGLNVKLDKLFLANSISVLLTLLSGPVFYSITGVPETLRRPWAREIRVFIAGFCAWLVFVLYENLLGVGVLKGRDVEFLGFLIFAGCLGFITVSRSLAKEETLLTISKELDIARQIQASTLPREVPRIPGLQIAARYVPMSAVAGDFYDFLVVDEKHVGILVADVTGHGVPAALIASMLKVAFAGQVENAENPARVLAGLNRALCGKFEEHFVTAAYLFVDLAQGVMRYAGAGHPPLLIASPADGEVRPVEENGLMLGLFPEAAYTSAEIHLQAGDRCLLYTDGLFEATDGDRNEFGKPRLGQFLRAHAELPAPQLAAALLEDVARWSGHSVGRRQEDDITLLVLDFKNATDAAHWP